MAIDLHSYAEKTLPNLGRTVITRSGLTAGPRRDNRRRGQRACVSLRRAAPWTSSRSATPPDPSHRHIGADHLLLAVARVDEALLALALERLRDVVAELRGAREPRESPDALPFSAEAIAAIETADRPRRAGTRISVRVMSCSLSSPPEAPPRASSPVPASRRTPRVPRPSTPLSTRDPAAPRRRPRGLPPPDTRGRGDRRIPFPRDLVERDATSAIRPTGRGYDVIAEKTDRGFKSIPLAPAGSI